MTATPPRQLTAKGLATRTRIVEAAANLIYAHGAHAVSNEDVRKAAGVSGSQLSHYFADKDALVRAVIAWQADRIVDLHKIPQLGGLDTFDALRLWADSYIEREELCHGGCTYGSLAAELVKTGGDVRADLSDGFRRWEDLFREGLRAMRDRGDLRRTADPDHLADVIMAAFQGGMLLTAASRDVTPLRNSLNGALAYVASFATRRSALAQADGGVGARRDR